MLISDWSSDVCSSDLTINVLVLLIPVLGLMHLDQYRDSLIAAEIDSLRIQARAFSLSLGSTAVVATQVGDERLLPEVTRKLRSEEHTSELQSLMRISYAVFCLKKKKKIKHTTQH